MIMRALLLFAFCAGAAGAADDNVALPSTPEDLARGKKLYLAGCTYCHGPTGDGGKGADLSRRDLRVAKTDGDLVRVIEVGIPGTEMPGAWHMTRREVTQTAAFVRSLAKVETSAPVTGNAERGKAVYARQGCGGCHTTPEGGGFSGPDLAIIGSRRGAGHIRESIVDPTASLAGSYVFTTVTLPDGRKVMGQRLFEDTFTVNVRDLGGNNHSFDKSKVKSVENDPKRSPMPSYKDKLSGAELDDLVAYLVSLKESAR